MPATIELQRTGFFREMPHGRPGDPSLADARSSTQAPHEGRVATYLAAGHVYVASPATTPDVLDPGTQIGPPHLLTDGRFVWPADLAHYVRAYHVRLDGAFLEHMLANGWTIPADVDLATLAQPGPPDSERAAPPASGVGTGAADAPAGNLAGVLAGLVDAMSRGGKVDTESITKSIEHAGDQVVRAIGKFGDDLRRSIDTAGSKASTRMSASLNNLRSWMEKPAEERAAQVQAFMSSLETRLQQALDPQHRDDEARNREPSASQVRKSSPDQQREDVAPGEQGGTGSPRDDDGSS